MAREQFPIKELGAAICEARERVGLSQAGLGNRVGVASVTIKRWENGETPKVRDRLDRLSTALGLNEYDLVDRAYELAGREAPTSQPRGDERLVEMIRDLQGGQADLMGRIGQLEDLLKDAKKSERPQGSRDPKQNSG
jgi:transcriptional regulator with XRE-family HTH domain